ncbi:hypothetical protein EDD15DRAFT_2269553 [Pisolithus albus]|nr:hypothetical protein EDD15DRAFT_2269553 [Pisolithus albus]
MDAASTPVHIYNTFQALVRSASLIDVVTGLAFVWAISTAIRVLRKQSRTTKLRGPKGGSLLFGVSKELFESPDTGWMFETWSREYGVAYELRMLLGQKRIILYTRSYVGTPGHKAAVARNFGFLNVFAHCCNQWRWRLPVSTYNLQQDRKFALNNHFSTARVQSETCHLLSYAKPPTPHRILCWYVSILS